jgi:hypothetical protein
MTYRPARTLSCMPFSWIIWDCAEAGGGPARTLRSARWPRHAVTSSNTPALTRRRRHQNLLRPGRLRHRPPPPWPPPPPPPWPPPPPPPGPPPPPAAAATARASTAAPCCCGFDGDGETGQGRGKSGQQISSRRFSLGHISAPCGGHVPSSGRAWQQVKKRSPPDVSGGHRHRKGRYYAELERLGTDSYCKDQKTQREDWQQEPASLIDTVCHDPISMLVRLVVWPENLLSRRPVPSHRRRRTFASTARDFGRPRHRPRSAPCLA